MAKYEISEQGQVFTTLEAASAEQALKDIDPPDAGDYRSESTVWITWYAHNVDDRNNSNSRDFTIDPEVPECEPGQDHEWQDHDQAVGSGGGIKFSERCRHCATVKRTDTWATNPTDGTQGHTSIAFENPERD